LEYFQSPESQPQINPRNCGAVTGQLLGLVGSKIANEMTMLMQGTYPAEWTNYVSTALNDNVTLNYYQIEGIGHSLKHELFPGFGTMVGIAPDEGHGHWFVVGKRLDNQALVILDPQIRKGFLDFPSYFATGNFIPIKFAVFLRTSPKTEQQHFLDGLTFGSLQCSMQPDVEMQGARRRKRRKTKRRLVAKRTLRRMNRLRRLL
jgi:hypothetical protein